MRPILAHLARFGRVATPSAAVVDAWPELPEALKADIVAMVKAALGGRSLL